MESTHVTTLANGPILVPLDGSEFSERSLPYAKAMARVLQRRIVLMIAAYISEIPEHGPWSDEMVARPQEVCMQYLSTVRDRFAIPDAEMVVKVNYPHEAIFETLAHVDASLIVVSTHGRSGPSRWVYGSTAGHLIHAARVPLFVIGKDVPDRQSPDFSPKHVLVPLDGSALGEVALPSALEVAEAFDARVTLLRAVPFSVEAYPMMVPSMYWPKLDDDLIAGAIAYLETLSTTLRRRVDVKVLQGARADVLREFVETNSVDLVVMTTHGRAGLQRAVLGSTADRMLQGAAPVLLIRPPEPASG